MTKTTHKPINKTFDYLLCFSLLLVIPGISHATAAAGLVDGVTGFFSELYTDLLPLAVLAAVVSAVTLRFKIAGVILLAIIFGGFLFSDLDTFVDLLNPF